MPTNDKARTAIRALRNPKGVTADQLKELTGWRVKPSPGLLKRMADTHGYKVQQTVIYHFVPRIRPEAVR